MSGLAHMAIWQENGPDGKKTIMVNAYGWGEIYDEDGNYCGAFDPAETPQRLLALRNQN